ncbi:unnamed protein product [Polarella glacialis]|uniref:Uncharacterized protein n=1 Tax=Polarella glacialis TaxID=89957 RepID=A0A813KXK3_POLGL|nr:unnamed protein product [Polarella glacialis]
MQAQAAGMRMTENESLLPVCRSLENLSLGGVAAMSPQTQPPKKYRSPIAGEVSTFQGAGVVPVTRMADGKARVLMWQPQKGKKKGVRWYDFGGRKIISTEFTSACACRKFAKETYGIFGCQIDMKGEDTFQHLSELYQGLANLPLMLRASEEWAKLQLLDDDTKIFYNDIHEYHAYMLCVPHVSEDILNQVSKIVDGGKRVFKWMTSEELAKEVLAPRLHTASFVKQLETLPDEPWIRSGQAYGKGPVQAATGCFSAALKS